MHAAPPPFDNIEIDLQPLFAMVMAEVTAAAVSIVLAVGLIVFVVETHHVTQRKAVMRGDQIDAGVRQTLLALEHIAGRGKAPGKFTVVELAVQPVTARGIAEMVIPFGEPHGKIAHLIAAGTDIPRLSNQFDL